MNIFYFRKLLFAAVLLLCGTVVNAHDFEVGGIYYNITDTTAKTVEVTYRGSYSTHYDDKYDDEVFIPVTVTYDSKTYSVTSIRNCAFEGCDYLKNVTIGNSVTSIGSSAFEGCGALSSITIPNSVKTIGSFAFYECDRLYKVQISDLSAWCTIDFGGYYSNPLSYAGNLYLNERLVTRFVISSNITSISNFAFSNCQSITSVIIPNSVTSIGNCAFSDCTNLKSITIGNGVTTIRYKAFYNCKNLKEVINLSILSLNAGTTYNGYIAYYANRVISTPDVSLVDDFVFLPIDGVNTLVGYCGNDINIILPDNCNGQKYVVGENAFKDYVKLKHISIVDGITIIGKSAFEGCTNLESLYISSDIESIGNNAFTDCNNLMEIKTGAIRAVTANENIFSTDAYNNVCLYVPTGRKFAYEKAVPWNKFYITEMDFTGITEISPDATEDFDGGAIYDLQGRPVSEPAKGSIYIIDGKKVAL